MYKPASSILSYCTPGIICTPFICNPKRCAQPVVLPRPAPTFEDLRCSNTICRGDGSGCGFMPSTPPRASRVISIPHSRMKASISWLGTDLPWLRYSAVSKPIPPAPIMATLPPTGFLSRSTSRYVSTLLCSIPSMAGVRGTIPVASSTTSNPPSFSVCAVTGVFNRTSTPSNSSCLPK